MSIEQMSLEKECTVIRNKIKDIADAVLTFKDDRGIMSLSDEMLAESKANVMLAYRHLEDARMRVGKLMQCLQGGISKYDEQEQVRIIDKDPREKPDASISKITMPEVDSDGRPIEFTGGKV